METANSATVGDLGHKPFAAPDSDQTNPELIKVLRAEEILAEMPRPANADGGHDKGTPATIDEPPTSAPSRDAS